MEVYYAYLYVALFRQRFLDPLPADCKLLVQPFLQGCVGKAFGTAANVPHIACTISQETAFEVQREAENANKKTKKLITVIGSSLAVSSYFGVLFGAITSNDVLCTCSFAHILCRQGRQKPTEKETLPLPSFWGKETMRRRKKATKTIASLRPCAKGIRVF